MVRPGLYRHFKGGMYRVLFVVENATNGLAHDQVIYLSLQNGKMYARDVNEFVQIVDKRTGKKNGPSVHGLSDIEHFVDRFTHVEE